MTYGIVNAAFVRFPYKKCQEWICFFKFIITVSNCYRKQILTVPATENNFTVQVIGCADEIFPNCWIIDFKSSGQVWIAKSPCAPDRTCAEKLVPGLVWISRQGNIGIVKLP